MPRKQTRNLQPALQMIPMTSLGWVMKPMANRMRLLMMTLMMLMMMTPMMKLMMTLMMTAREVWTQPTNPKVFPEAGLAWWICRRDLCRCR